MYLSVSMKRELSLNFHRNNVYGHLEQVSRTCVYFHFQITQLVLQTCAKCPYTLFLWKFNDSSLCIGNGRYICTTICKHTMNSGLCRIFWKIPRLFWLNFQGLASICYLLVNSLLCSDSVKWDTYLMYKMSLVNLRIKPGQTCQHMHTGNHTKPLSWQSLQVDTSKTRYRSSNATLFRVIDLRCDGIHLT